MGIAGLTTYLSKCGGKYKKKIIVSNQLIVIDGSNLMFHLYSSYAVKKDHHYLFGGDCAAYSHAVRLYFQKLKCCAISPIVIFDGAYEPGKLKTKMKRFAKSLKENVRQDTPGKSYTTILMKEVILEILAEQNIDCFQTEFEADDTIAYVAQQLSCPVLSSDSDFYMYANVTTIPLETVRFRKRQLKTEKKNGDANQKIVGKPSAYVMEGKCIILREMCLNEFKISDCKLLPLTAVVIGNDQVSTTVFSKFLPIKNENGGASTKYHRIAYLLKWFGRQSSFETALETMLGSIKGIDRESMREVVTRIVDDYMGNGGEDYIWNLVKSSKNLQPYVLAEPRAKGIVQGIILDLEDNAPSKTVDSVGASPASLDELLEALNIQNEGDDVDADENKDDEKDGDDDDSAALEAEEDDAEDESDEESSEESDSLPAKPDVPLWFLESLCKCKFPEPVSKILYNQAVYLAPQVEVTTMPSSHAVGVPIIQAISGVLYGPGTLTLISRDKYNPVKLEVPTITSFEKGASFPCVTSSSEDFRQSLAHDKRLRIFLQGLLIPGDEEFIHEWPQYLKFWIASCLYYLRKLRKTKDMHLAITVAITVILSLLKSYSFSTSAPGNKAQSTNDSNASVDDNISNLLKKQALNKSVEKLLQGFVSIPKVGFKKFWTNYDMSRVFLYSQFHSVIFYAMTLNSLLGDPLRPPKVSSMNCHMVFNICGSVVETFGGRVTEFMDFYLDARSPLRNALMKFINVALQGSEIIVPEISRDIRSKRSKAKKKPCADENGDPKKLNRFMLLATDDD